jgi:hypothetical protein
VSVPPTPTPEPAEVYAAIERDVVGIRGLEPKREVDPQVLNAAQVRERMEKLFARDNPPDLVHANEQLLKGLGLVPEDADLKKLSIDMQTSSVAGFYDPVAKELFVVSQTGALGPVERVTFAHEFTHALQDQHFDLTAFYKTSIGQSDRGLAGLSVIEGDATAVMTVWAQENLNLVELLQLGTSSDPESLRLLDDLPPILRESLLFPYQTGLQFVLELQARGGEEEVDDAFDALPLSTEQVMHFEKYEAHEKPVAMTIDTGIAGRMGQGWKETLQDTLGEFQIGVWLRGNAGDANTPTAAAAGWGGDRIALLEGPNDAWAILWLTSWDTEQDAREFRDAAADTIAATDAVGGLNLDGKRVRVVLASDDAAREKLTFALD